jgi:rhodanese-related sulfurtransferase
MFIVLKRKFHSIFLLSVLSMLGVISHTVQAEEALLQESLENYFDFASFADGVVPASKLNQLGEIQVIDARTEQAYEKSHIPGAVNIEWRQVVFNLDQIAKDKLVVLYCDTGILSSKAHLALRLLGYENARVLMGGYAAYQAEMAK